MRIRDRISVIFLLILASVATSTGANYIGGIGSVPPNAMLASDGNGTNAQIRGIGNTEQHREDRPSSSLQHLGAGAGGHDTLRGKKTLALLLLMLRDGPGAR